jgi:uncharacterized protein (DUF2235 family)
LYRSARVRVCALWDTVESLGIPRSPLPIPPFRPPASPLIADSQLRNIAENVFQALSLHEYRRPFQAIVARQPPDSRCRLEQCWFMGYHSDIGGGRNEETLAHFALAWMITKLRPYIDFDFTTLWWPAPSAQSWRVGSKHTTLAYCRA